MPSILYYLGLAFLFTHELDAVTHSEWRLLFYFFPVPEALAAPLFVGIHVPLFFLVLWLSQHPKDSLREPVRLIVAGFLVLHFILHQALSGSELYEFHGWLSNSLIAGAGVCGAAWLVLRWRHRS